MSLSIDDENAWVPRLQRWGNGEDARRMSIKTGSWVIGGAWRHGERAVIQAGMFVRHFPDFCGGMLAHSPRVSVSVSGEWGDAFPVNCKSHTGWETRMFDIGTVWDLPEAPDHAEYVDLGYYMLATMLMQEMMQASVRGCVLAGPEDDCEVQEFVDVAGRVSRYRRGTAVQCDARNDGHPPRVPQIGWDGLVPCRIAVHTVPGYNNLNTGHFCHWHMLELCSPWLECIDEDYGGDMDYFGDGLGDYIVPFTRPDGEDEHTIDSGAYFFNETWSNA